MRRYGKFAKQSARTRTGRYEHSSSMALADTIVRSTVGSLALQQNRDLEGVIRLAIGGMRDTDVARIMAKALPLQNETLADILFRLSKVAAEQNQLSKTSAEALAILAKIMEKLAFNSQQQDDLEW